MFKAMTDTGPPATAPDQVKDGPPPDIRGQIANICDIAALLAVPFGVGMWSIPAGVITGGLSCVLLGWKIDRER